MPIKTGKKAEAMLSRKGLIAHGCRIGHVDTAGLTPYVFGLPFIHVYFKAAHHQLVSGAHPAYSTPQYCYAFFCFCHR